MRNAKLILLLILLAACIFRLFALGWGLPFRHNDDETNYIETALRIGAGKFMPEQIAHGALFQHILFVIYGLYFLIGKLAGIFTSTEAFLLSYLRDPSTLTILARMVVFVFSIATLYLTYLIGKRLFSEKAGLLACLLLSFSTMHYMMSTTGLADMVAAFFLLLSFYILLKYYFHDFNTGYLKHFYLSGFILGLAAAAKLLTAPGIVAYLAIYYFKEKGHSPILSRKLFLGLFFVFLGFFIAEPYPFFDIGKLWWVISSVKSNYMGTAKVTSPATGYLLEWLPNSLGKVSVFMFFASCVYFVFRRKKAVLFIMLFPIFHFLSYYLLGATGLAYHTLPGLAFIALAISAFLCDINLNGRKWSNLITTVLIGLCIFNPALDSLRYYKLITARDTRSIAKEWIEENINTDKTIILEGALGNELVLAPKLNENMESLKDSLKWVKEHGGSGRFQKILIKNYSGEEQKNYRLYKVTQYLKPEDALTTEADYLITSGFFDLGVGEFEGHRTKEYYNRRQELWRVIKKKFILVKKFEPFPRFSVFYPLFFTDDFNALREINIFTIPSKISPGPELRIYERSKKEYS